MSEKGERNTINCSYIAIQAFIHSIISKCSMYPYIMSPIEYDSHTNNNVEVIMAIDQFEFLISSYSFSEDFNVNTVLLFVTKASAYRPITV